MRSAPAAARSQFVRAGPSGGLLTWYFVPGSDARREIPSTALKRDGEVITVTAGADLPEQMRVAG
jgi:hypothetical protein